MSIFHIRRNGGHLCGFSAADLHSIEFDDRSGLKHVNCWRCICMHLERAIPAMPAMPETNKLATLRQLSETQWENLLVFLRGTVAAAEPSDRTQLATRYLGIDEEKIEAESAALRGFVDAISKTKAWALSEGRKQLPEYRVTLVEDRVHSDGGFKIGTIVVSGNVVGPVSWWLYMSDEYEVRDFKTGQTVACRARETRRLIPSFAGFVEAP